MNLSIERGNMENKIRCRHGEYDLIKGCPECIAEFRMWAETLITYKVGNKYTHERQIIKAESAQEACEKLGWSLSDCWVRIIKEEK